MNWPSNRASGLPSLAEHFSECFAVGVAAEPTVLQEQGEIVAHHFRRLTAENAMKFGALSCREHELDFAKADVIAKFARQHSMKMTGHTFVWHQMHPGWLFKAGDAAASREVVSQRLRDFIFRMTERYSDVVDNWDVVNEAISDRPDTLWRNGSEHSQWFETFGSEDYVVLAFQYAAEAAARFAPDTKLYYNDYDIEIPSKRQKVIEAVRELRSREVRIDGVGIQGHIKLDWPSASELAQAIDDFAAEELLVKISELDISIYTQDDVLNHVFQAEIADSAELDERIAARYAEVFSVFREKAKKLTSVTLWGVSDDQSWLNYWPARRKNYPLLFDREHEPKAALLSVLEL
jgi:endo-1,4-beta-xylanase